jgi:hypothetical protein
LQGIPSLGELKLRYYQLMITYHQHYHSYLEICRCYKAIYESDGVQDDPAQWGPVSVRGLTVAGIVAGIAVNGCTLSQVISPSQLRQVALSARSFGSSKCWVGWLA